MKSKGYTTPPETLNRKGRKLYGYQVKEIKDLAEIMGYEFCRSQAGRDYGVSAGMISHIVTGRYWKDI